MQKNMGVVTIYGERKRKVVTIYEEREKEK
jgi:hypothetical protein